MNRSLINYLPPVLREVLEFQAINRTNEAEISQAWAALEQLMANQFLLTADDIGISMREKELNIRPKETDSLEDRRFRILARYMEDRPYTLSKLREILEALCGKDNFSAEIAAGTYELAVKVGLAAKSNFGDVEALLERVVPENLVVTLALLYNTYSDLSAFTHGQLAASAHYDLRNEVLN